MGESARDHRETTVIEMADWMGGTIAMYDEAIEDLTKQRNAMAVRLAVFRASEDGRVLDAAADYEHRVESGQPYESAEPAKDVLSDAYKRFVQPK